MSQYDIELDKQAEKDIEFWQKNSPKDYKKVMSLIDELEQHPTTGSGCPKRLHCKGKKWSREINKKDRMVYTINNTEIYVYVFSARGHYDDH